MHLIFFKTYRDQVKQQRGMYAELRIEERNNDLNHRFGKQPLKEFLTILSRTFGKRGVKLGFQRLDLGSGLARAIALAERADFQPHLPNI
jgi:hypothetical protein